MLEFDQSVMKYPSIKRFPGGGSTDLIPNLQNPDNPAPLLDPKNMPKATPAAND
jgi:arylsulfatase